MLQLTNALPYAVMEGNGAYNRNAKLQINGATFAFPFLEKAVQRIALDPALEPLVLADYGSSQGKNSLAPINVAIRNLRPRISAARSILVFHVDQPSNDFNTLFEVLSSDPSRYALDGPNVFPCAVGRSFYEQVLPGNSVHLGWCSYAAVWLSRAPTLIPGHFFPYFSTGAVRVAFERQAGEDWDTFLTARAKEMRSGARLVVVLPAAGKDGVLAGFAEFMDHANAVLAELEDDGAITAEERARMVLGSYARRQDELLAPFDKNGQFHGLTVEDFETAPVPDPAWVDYQSDGDSQALASKQARFFRAAFMPSLAAALTDARAAGSNAMHTFAGALENRLMLRLTGHPTPADSFVQILVLAKRA